MLRVQRTTLSKRLSKVGILVRFDSAARVRGRRGRDGKDGIHATSSLFSNWPGTWEGQDTEFYLAIHRGSERSQGIHNKQDGEPAFEETQRLQGTSVDEDVSGLSGGKYHGPFLAQPFYQVKIGGFIFFLSLFLNFYGLLIYFSGSDLRLDAFRGSLGYFSRIAPK